MALSSTSEAMARTLTPNGFASTSDTSTMDTGLEMQLDYDGFGSGGSSSGVINLGIGMPMGQKVAIVTK